MSDLDGPEVHVDCWSEWLLSRRHGEDPNYDPIMRGAVSEIRDRVIHGAALTSVMTLLDVGAGDGLISFEALRRVKHPFSVVFSDISGHLLNRAKEIATELGFLQQFSFIQAPAKTLSGISSESVDMITSRAVLAYVHDKPRPSAASSAFSDQADGSL